MRLNSARAICGLCVPLLGMALVHCVAAEPPIPDLNTIGDDATTPSEASVEAGSDTTAPQQEGGAEGGTDAGADGNDASCVPGAACDLGACQSGATQCVNGQTVCKESGTASNGSPCDAGVCN